MAAAATAISCPRLLLFGLEESLTADLMKSLAGAFDPVSLPALPGEPEAIRRILRDSGAKAVFISGAQPAMSRLIEAAAAVGLPAIVVTRTPDVREWLDAMDAGAADYAAPPFDPGQLVWMLCANLRV